MESFVRRNNNVNSFFERISDTTRNNPATNVAQIATNGTMINIRGKKIEFNRRDEIFSLVKPTEEKQNNDYCNLCDKEIKKSSKRKDCEFCGYFYCKSCIFKSRPFAGSSDDAPKGENSLDEVQAKIQEKIDEDCRFQREFECEIEDMNTKMEVILNRIREVTNENEILGKRIQARSEDGNKKQEEKAKLSNEIEVLKKEMDRLLEVCNKLAAIIKKNEETRSTTGSMRGGKAPRQGQKRDKKNKSPNMTDSVQSYNTNPDFCVNDDEKVSKKKKGNLKSSIVKQRAKQGNSKHDDQCLKCLIF